MTLIYIYLYFVKNHWAINFLKSEHTAIIDLLIKQGKVLQDVAQLAEVAKYTDCISAEDKTPPMSVQDMTLNNLMVRLQ